MVITVLQKWLINSILWHFKINADVSILEKYVILGLSFCAFAAYSVLTYAKVGYSKFYMPNFGDFYGSLRFLKSLQVVQRFA